VSSPSETKSVSKAASWGYHAVHAGENGLLIGGNHRAVALQIMMDEKRIRAGLFL
jgi:hypothetical protein